MQAVDGVGLDGDVGAAGGGGLEPVTVATVTGGVTTDNVSVTIC
jgi:hypothetical protein